MGGGEDRTRTFTTTTATTTTREHPADAAAGLVMDVFYFPQGGRLPDLTGRTPDMTRVEATVNHQGSSAFPGFAHHNDFAVRWTGLIEIISAGTYRFSTTSDDGSRMRIKGQVEVDNDGLHGMREVIGNGIHLETGLHPVELEMFEKGGGHGMVFRYSGPDTGNEFQVPQDQLWHRPSGGVTTTTELPTTTSTSTVTTT